ncbi:hypothetical protein B9S64_27050 [Streptomyces sp. SM18]|nr:hypothetical protein B9S64_27050 [Streptomyces sp. SM18]
MRAVRRRPAGSGGRGRAGARRGGGPGPWSGRAPAPPVSAPHHPAPGPHTSAPLRPGGRRGADGAWGVARVSR